MDDSAKTIKRRMLNRFSLSFKDSNLEKAFLDEYNENAYRVISIYIPLACILSIFIFFLSILLPILQMLHNLAIFVFVITLLLFLYFRIFPPKKKTHFQSICMVAETLLGWIYAYILIAVESSYTVAFGIAATHMVATSISHQLRFVYSFVALRSIWVGFGIFLFAFSDLRISTIIIEIIILDGLINFCLFGSYHREAMARVNFYQRRMLEEQKQQVTDLTDLLKKMFGRYLSTEVMNSLIENPSALELGGERRKVTIMMTDLRGFTALSERLEPEQVVQMLNAYFEVMVEVVLKYNGTINEIIGDALLVIFGAPQEMTDRAQRAIACAIEMQNAMAKVNKENRGQGLPELEMGIGLNETEVIVGNIGSSKRSKYAVVGSGVNMTSRIESYTVGGQILISESVRQEAGEVLRIDSQRDVLPKGAETPLRIYEVGGIAGHYNLALEGEVPSMVTLSRQIPLRYTVLEGKDVGKKGLEGSVVRLSKTWAEITVEEPVEIMTNLKMNLGDVDENLSVRDFYGKVIKRSEEKGKTHMVHFTSVPPEVDAYFQALRQYAAN